MYPGSGSGEWLKMQREQNRCQNLEKAQKKLSLTFSSREESSIERILNQRLIWKMNMMAMKKSSFQIRMTTEYCKSKIYQNSKK